MVTSLETSISHSVDLTASGTGTQLDLTLQISLPGPEYHSTGSSMAPGIPYDLLDTLWSQGLCEGVISALNEADYSLTTSDFHVEFLQLKIPFDLEELDDNQLETLPAALFAMAKDGVIQVLNALKTPGETGLTLEQAEELIYLHAGRLDEHPRESSSLQSLLMQAKMRSIGQETGLTIPDELGGPDQDSTDIIGLEQAFRDIMRALSIFQAAYADQANVSKEVVIALWWICRSGRWWAEENAKARSDAAGEPYRRCVRWIDTIAYTTQEVLAGASIDVGLLLKISLEPDYAGPTKIS